MQGYHSAQVEVDVRLNTNESPEGPPAEFAAALATFVATAAFHRYPDRAATALRAAIADLHGVRPDQVFAANGSNEVLQCLLLAFGGPGRSALVFEPTYALHSHIARVTGTKVITATRNDDSHARRAARHRGGWRGGSDRGVPVLAQQPDGRDRDARSARRRASPRRADSSSSTRPTASSRRGRPLTA